MQLIALISDYGTSDHYSAELKAALYTHCENISILDVSHQIALYDISLAAYYLKSIIPSLPKSAITIVAVNNYYTKVPKYLVFQLEDRFFIGPDNGVFTLLFEEIPQAYEINMEQLMPMQSHEIYAHASACIHHGLPLDEFATPIHTIEEKIAFRPVVTSNQIKATIIHVDAYENVVTNLTRELFDRARNGRMFSIYYKPNDPIEYLSRHYGDAMVGETLAWFNPSGHLEIAINMGKASSTLHLFNNETIQIDFH
jgi:S-adenosyl-L-methionine hydrolase (adenosine-forming)